VDAYDNYLTDYYEAKLKPSAGYTDFRFAKFRQNYLTALGRHPNGSLLEVGPGMGEFMLFAEREAGVGPVQGVDYAPDCAAHCQSLGLDVQHIDDLRDWLASRQSVFSTIVMLHVLEHIPKGETVATLAVIREALVPGGTLIVEVPNAGNPWLSGVALYEDFTHEVGFTSGSLRTVMTRAGFAHVVVAGVKVPWRSRYAPVRAANELGNTLTRAMTRLSAPRADHLLDAQIYAVAST